MNSLIKTCSASLLGCIATGAAQQYSQLFFYFAECVNAYWSSFN